MKITEFNTEELKFALWNCFPSVEIFHNLKADDKNISFFSRMIDLSYEKKLIKKKDASLLEVLIRTKCELHKGRMIPKEFSFDSLMAEIKKVRSIKSLVVELKELAKELSLEIPNAVLITRMRKNFHAGSFKRRQLLLLLSIWLSKKMPNLALNYAVLSGFPKSIAETAVDESVGVLVVFSFTGENIDAPTVDFLKNELPVCINDLKLAYLKEKRLTFLATTCMARLPVRKEAPGLPATYGQAMQDTLSLAYQIMVTWQLSNSYRSNINLIVAIDAGEFTAREITIKELMTSDLSPLSPIRLSHFAYSTARQANLKVVFRSIKYPNVWSVDHFWLFPYFKSPPVLMPKSQLTEDSTDILPLTDATVRNFREALFIKNTNEFGILSMVHNFPPKILAFMEIANITTMRRLHHEAIRILSYVLSFEPLNHIARTLRLHNYMALATCSNDPATAAMLFEKAINEGQFIEQNCIPDPEFYSEYCLVYWSRAIRLIRFLRKGVIVEDRDPVMIEILALLKRGETYAGKGLAVSATGEDSRCNYWLLYCRAFRRLLEKDPELMTDIKRPMEDRHNLFPEIFSQFANANGWIPPADSTGQLDEIYMQKRAKHSTDAYLNSLSSTHQYPHASFGVCSFLWDFSGPDRKKQVIEQILMFLDIISIQMKELKRLCLGTYSATSTLIEIQTPEEYSRCIDLAKREILKVRNGGDYNTGMKLLLLNLDNETGNSPITFDLIQKEGTH